MSESTHPPVSHRNQKRRSAPSNVEIHQARKADDWLLRTTAALGENFLDACAEYAWNGRDAGASVITIEFFNDDDGDLCLRFTDDGMGMNKRRRTAFLAWGMSDWDTTASIRGKNGTGRLGGFHHCARISAETKPSGEGLFFTGFTVAEIMKMWDEGQGTWEDKPLPARHLIKTTGTVVTLHKLGQGKGVNPRHHRTAKRLVDGLAKLLPIDLARKIRVRDESGTTHELKQRKLRGKVIEGDHHDVPLVGDVSYHLGVVDEHEANVDAVDLFAMSKVCSLEEFFSAVADLDDPSIMVYLKACRAVLCHPLVSGIVDVPDFNQYVGDDRKRAGERLMERVDKLRALLKFLRETVVPPVENAIGLKSDQIERSDDETLIRSLLEQLGAKGGGRRAGGRGGEPDAQTTLGIDESQFYVVCGGTHAITVTDPRDDGTITWDVRGGGTLDRTSGPRVTLTASATPMRGEIRVKETLEGQPTRESVIHPVVVEELPFQFNLAVRSATPLQRITLKLYYPKRVRGRIAWTVTPPGGATFERKGDPDGIGIEESVFSATTAGTYSVEASVPGTDLLKVCTVLVAERSGSDTRSPSRREFSYGEHLYELQVRNFPKGVDGERHAVTPSDGGEGRTVIRANLNNSQFAGKPDAVRLHALLLHISGIVAEVELRKAGTVITAPALRFKGNEVFANLASRKKAAAS